MKFTDRSIRSIKPRESRFEVWEDGRSGFGLRVAPSGKKSWIYLYRINGRPRRMTFGHYPDVSLAEAHEAHALAEKKLSQGIDPGAEEQGKKTEDRKAPTVETLVNEFVEKGLKFKGNRSWKEYRRNLYKDVVPAWGDRKAKDIRKRDVILLLEGIAARGAQNQSTQVFKIIRRMFNFAVERDILEFTPCAQVKPLAPDRRKERFLSETEIKTFWISLETCGMTDELKRALRLILLTAQRPGEVVGAHSDEFEDNWWTIPAERSKNKRAHRVFLTPLAISLFQAEEKKGYLFPSPRPKVDQETGEREVKPIEVNALAHALRRAFQPDPENQKQRMPLQHFTPHDLRRTAASHMAALGFGIIVEKILNHTNRTVTAIYDRYDYDKEKQQALESWSRKLNSIITGANAKKVIPLKKSTKNIDTWNLSGYVLL